MHCPQLQGRKHAIGLHTHDGVKLGALGVEADALVGLLLRADAHVTGDGGPSLLHEILLLLKELRSLPSNLFVAGRNDTKTNVFVSACCAGV